MIPLLIRYVLPVAVVALWIYALVDAVKVPDDSMYRSGNKLIWVLVILLAPVLIGPIVYLVVGRPARTPSYRPPPDDVI